MWDKAGVTTALFEESFNWENGGKINIYLDDEILNLIGIDDVSDVEKKGDFYSVNYTKKKINPYVPGNQEAIAKQGKGLGEAIKKIKGITNSSKVILIGHSMGGLASRDYIQGNFYQGDVYKLITIGTPHLGSIQAEWIIDHPALAGFVRNLHPMSDAIRDLSSELPAGVYLNGGEELNIQGNRFYSRDVNKDGVEGGYIWGLNNTFLPKDIVYVAIVGEFLTFKGDGVVSIESQDIRNVGAQEAEIIKIKAHHLEEAARFEAISTALSMEIPLIFKAGSPVDLVITDPRGFIIGKNKKNMEGANYFEFDFDADGILDPQVMVMHPVIGTYIVEVFPRLEAGLLDTFSITTIVNGSESILVPKTIIGSENYFRYHFNYGENANPPIPEPSSLLLILLGIICFSLKKIKIR